MLVLTWLAGLVRRRTARLAGLVIGLALAVAMLASLGMFFAASRAHMTEQAVAAVPVDWQVQLAPGADVAKAETTIAKAPGVASAVPVSFAETPGFSAKTSGTLQSTGSGKVLGLPPTYAATFPDELRYLLGAPSGVLLAQQTAANLHATVGTVVRIRRPGLPAADEKVAGIVDLPYGDSLFQTIGAPAGAAPTAPPDNVMLLPISEWHRLFDPATAGSTATQVHVDLSPSLPPDPGAAFTEVTGRARNLEAALVGAGLVGDNIGAQLDAARSDAIYAQLLFMFLGLPGVVLAGLLTMVVASSGRERRRREQALLRTRGATPQRIVRLAAVEAALVGTIGSGIGLAGAWASGRLAFGTSRFGPTTTQALLWAGIAVIVGFALSFVAIALPAWRDARMLTVRSSLAAIGVETGRPIWQRMYLDLLCLAGGGLIYWQAVRSGYQVVLAPEGVPTISVGTFTLLAPVLFWIGEALLSWRLGGLALARGRRTVARLSRPFAHGLSGVVAASMSRQRRTLARGMVLGALTACFALSVAIFDTTYAAQARVDAQLTNGADVSVQTTPGNLRGLPPSLAPTVRALPGVAAAQPMLHRFAYVGNDLQDLYGIDASTIARATAMSDAYFAGGNAHGVLATLAHTADGVMVSDETVHDFQLQPGDLLRLRMQSLDGAYHVVPFHFVGIVREFPTAPRDSFLVANASYVGQQTGSATAQTLLVRADGSPPAVAGEVRSVLGPTPGATVQDIVTQQRITLSGLTAIDLAGLTRLELAFALVLAAASSGLVLALGVAERRRTFAIASALGARQRQLAAFVWSEAAFVTIGGLVLGAGAGWWLSYVIVKILTGVFDPPPSHLSVPWAYLAVFVGAAVVAVVTAAWGTLRAVRRPALAILRDL
ncbi:MAG: FtsX-like permease family protein [Actinomycetota bacterium]